MAVCLIICCNPHLYSTSDLQWSLYLYHCPQLMVRLSNISGSLTTAEGDLVIDVVWEWPLPAQQPEQCFCLICTFDRPQPPWRRNWMPDHHLHPAPQSPGPQQHWMNSVWHERSFDCRRVYKQTDSTTSYMHMILSWPVWLVIWGENSCCFYTWIGIPHLGCLLTMQKQVSKL